MRTYATALMRLVRRVVQNRYMVASIVLRDIQSRYTGSFLGLFWAVIHPLTQLLVYYFVFSLVLKTRLGEGYAGTNYALWLIAGLLPWMLLSEVISRAPGALIEQANLIKKTVFPSEILPVAHLSAAFVNHLILLTLLFVFLMTVGPPAVVRIQWIPVYLSAVIMFALGLAWLLSALNVFLRDIGQVLGVIVNLWFFFTPIVYPPEMVPESLRVWLDLNPMLHAVEGYRAALLGGAPPNASGLGLLFGTGAVVFIAGGALFRKLKPAFADVL